MFFEVHLLCRGGKFATIWIAANRGIRSLTKASIHSVDVVISSEEIMRYIISKSHSPRQRFSLSLSAKLIHGLCIIFRKHVEEVYNDTLKMMQSTPKTLLMEVSDMDESYDTPKGKPKKRAARKKREIHSDDTDLVAMNINVQYETLLRTLEEEERAPHRAADHADITIREVDERILLRQPQEREKQIEQYMDIGRPEDFEFIDNLMKTLDKYVIFNYNDGCNYVVIHNEH